VVKIIVNPGVVGVIVEFVDAVLDQGTYAEIFSEVFAQPRAVIALVSGEPDITGTDEGYRPVQDRSPGIFVASPSAGQSSFGRSC